MDVCKAAFLLGSLICTVGGDQVDGYTKTSGARMLLMLRTRYTVNSAAECAAECDAEINFKCSAFMYVKKDRECWTTAQFEARAGPHKAGIALYEKVVSIVECIECIGENYRGKVSTTENGHTCQHWDSQEPHNHDYSPSVHPDKNLQENYCRNPGGDPRPWCYTTDPSKRWDYCSIPRCTPGLPSIVPEFTCLSGKGVNYRGTIAETESGKMCQRWSAQTPHQHNRTPDNYPCKGLVGNYCRNPDNEKKPWCYTTDPQTRWEYCNVTSCRSDPEECVECIGENYRGKVSTTENGYTCQRWDSQQPHSHNYTFRNHPDKFLEENYCRNPCRDIRLWCYTTNPNKQWDYCSIPPCTTEPHPITPEFTCATGKGQAYRGIINVTESGKKCQSWSAQTPHKHKHTPDNYPCKGLENNYCRNPDNKLKPWCHTTDPQTSWEYCNVTSCGPDPEECLECIGENYRGKISTTENGYTCQSWFSQEPHKHSYNPNAGWKRILQENYCRNPSGDPRPWCYTTNPNKRWDYCSIPRCKTEPPTIIPELTCATGIGQAYRGKIAVTQSGKTCQRWSDQTPHKHNRMPGYYRCKGLENNYCRNPDKAKRPWCYTTDPETRWEYCNVTSCEPEPVLKVASSSEKEDCYEGDGSTYRGTKSETISGKTCTFWSASRSSDYLYTPEKDPHADLRENLCRNPDGDKAPWCYTIDDDETTWEYCNLKKCFSSK
ncbi:apolipoprotein(a)-like [Cheilinus undulatus]|uniref:apolipoprotein(a)-like n=1 Tax=Cheilinus undulatus TaxID=241271 RepID=UPI001BD20401|nr:apolipoprotein(a)-like [Cheilinus undulatus]